MAESDPWADEGLTGEDEWAEDALGADLEEELAELAGLEEEVADREDGSGVGEERTG